MARLYEYDFTDALTSNEAIRIFLADAVETGCGDHIEKALEVLRPR